MSKAGPSTPNHRLYYRLKPYIPWRIRTALRRFRAKRLRVSCEASWPILPSAGHTPEGWPGWPDGKRFAFVLTHDIESQKGVDRSWQLSQVEAKHGFRSAFNFIPEGEYRVPLELRKQLTDAGFEIGVHDLRHDGFLYRSREVFRSNAQRINHYLKEWNACGFRSGFMHHQLEWFDDLDVLYDASTFDTDPFEPQPDGVGTIFPFWVPGPNGRGYVELPYTLIQDFNLFIVLQERTIDIWKRKMEWIAQQGGMALLVVHPDYVNFAGQPADKDEFSVSLYEEFLAWVKQRFAGEYYHAVPREVARLAARVKPRHTIRTPMRACMVTSSIYESDNRVMRYAQALVRRGDSVDVIAVAKDDESPKNEVIDGVRVWRIQKKVQSGHKLPHLLSAVSFLLLSSLILLRQHLRRRYDLVHVHNMPDFLVFSAWFPKLTGTAVMLDIHDMFPEFYTSKFKAGNGSFAVGLLRRIERICAAFANHVIISNHLWQQTFTARSAPPEKCSVFLNNVDTDTFQPRGTKRNDGRVLILFPGGLQWHQGLDIAIRAFKEVARRVPNAEFHIYGDGNMKASLVALTQKLGLTDRVLFFKPVPVRQIADVMAAADLGIVPKRADSFGNEAYSTKIMEFMSVGVPVVVSSTRIDRFYFDDSVVRFFESGNEHALAEAIIDVLENPALRERLVQNARVYVQKNSWKTKRQEYLKLVDTLASPERDIQTTEPAPAHQPL